MIDSQGLFAILSLAFGFGLLHAFGADHILAISGLASTRPGMHSSLLFSLRWAIGHGSALFITGSAVLFLGMSLPAGLGQIAEGLVGVVLIAVGMWILYELQRKQADLHFSKHDDLSAHADHKHHVENRFGMPHRHDHGAVLVGLLHGLAGSASLLALIPISKLGSASYGFAYLAVFSAGTLVSMMLFGGLLGGVFVCFKRWGDIALRALQITIAVGSVGFGGFMIAEAL